MRKIIHAVILAIIAFATIITPISAAVTAPDSLTLLGVWAFRNNYESGDMTFIYYYNAAYATAYPDEVSSDTLLIRLLDGTTELGAAAPYPYYSNGYQRGVAALYFTAAEVTALETIMGHEMWGQAFTAALEPNPLIAWDSTPATSYKVITWDTATTQSAAQTNLGNRLITIALQLKAYWGVNLVEAADGLNYALTISSTTGSGVDYFMNVLSNMQQLAPKIFSTQVSDPIYNTTTPTLTDSLGNELPVDVTPSATVFGMSKSVLTGLVALVGVLAFSFFLVSKAPYMSRYLVLIDGTMIIYFTRIGAFVPVFVTVIGAVALLIIGIVMFYQPSSA